MTISPFLSCALINMDKDIRLLLKNQGHLKNDQSVLCDFEKAIINSPEKKKNWTTHSDFRFLSSSFRDDMMIGAMDV